MSLRMEAGFEHLREALAETLREEVDFPRGMLVTVLGAKMTQNTAHARIVLSVVPNTAQETVLETLREFQHEVKDGLAKRLRLRRIPNLHYVFDETEADAAVIEEHLKNLRASGEITPPDAE